jgi:hypothetical protein
MRGKIARLLGEAQSAVTEGNEPVGRLKMAASTTIASMYFRRR